MIVLLSVFGMDSVLASIPRPAWSAKTCVKQSENGSYLSKVEPLKKETLNDLVFLDAGDNQAMRTEFEKRVDADASRDHAGLTEQGEDISRFQAFKDLANRAVDSVTQLRLRIEGDNIARAAVRATENSPIRQPVAVAVLAASLYSGRAMNFKVGNSVHMRSTTALKDRSASLSMHLPASGITSSVGYTPESQLNAQLSKNISDRVSAVVNSANQGTAQLNYSVSF